MGTQLAWRRVVLKLSGELLGGADGRPVVPELALDVARSIKEAIDAGVQVGLVIGAGNIVRGQLAAHAALSRVSADQMGMLATVINALLLREALEARGVDATVQSAIPIPGVVSPFDHREAVSHLASGRPVIFAGGTGHPYFTTDTTAALRACQVGADAILKGTKVDGVYSADPVKDSTAVRYASVSFRDALAQRLGVLDSTAFSLCMDNDLPIIVFRFAEPGALTRIVKGDLASATLVGRTETVVG